MQRSTPKKRLNSAYRQINKKQLLKQSLTNNLFVSSIISNSQNRVLFSQSINLKPYPDKDYLYQSQKSRIWHKNINNFKTDSPKKIQTNLIAQQRKSVTSFIKKQAQIQPKNIDIQYHFVNNDSHLAKNKQINLDKARISSKKIGLLNSYAANSHRSNHQVIQSRQVRICIVTNLIKYQDKKDILSFYAIYQTLQKGPYIDYFRQNFHPTLAKQYHKDQSLKQTIEKIQKKIQYKYLEELGIQKNKQNNLFKTQISFEIVLVTNQHIHRISMGKCKNIVCINLGQKTMCNSQKLSKQIVVHSYSQNQSLDFIILASEGITRDFSEQKLTKQIWLGFLQFNIYPNKNIHQITGQTLNKLMKKLIKQGLQNISILILTFKNIQQCLKDYINIDNNVYSQIQLPYLIK